MDDGLILAELGRRIKMYRMQKNMSQQELAAKCGFEKSNMSRLESGSANTSVRTLNKICLALGMSICEMCDKM